MSNEAVIQSGLQVTKGSQNYRAQPTSFTADIAGNAGPTPGAILVATSRTDVDLTQITSNGYLPGLCRIQNLDSTNFIEIGVYDPTGIFYPIMELLPGEFIVIRLSRYLGEELDPTVGTGTYNIEVTQLSLKATVAACLVLVEAFAK